MFRSYGLFITFIVLSVIGCIMLPRLSVQLVPSAGGRTLTLSYTWPGASPEVMERHVTAKLEGVLATLAGVKKISSVSGYNHSYITLELDRTTNLDATRFEVAALVRQVYPQLPSELSFPKLSLSNPNELDRAKPLLILQLSGPASSGSLQRFADEQLRVRLAAVPNVDKVAVFGGNRPEWVLTYNADAIQVLQLTETDLQQAIIRYFRREPLGQLCQASGQMLRIVLNNEGFKKGNVWSQIPVSNRDGRTIYLSDLISTARQEPPSEQFYRINGKTAINIVLSSKPAANQLRVATDLRQQIKTLTLPPGYKLDISYDTTTYIRENLRKNGVQISVAIIVLLVLIALTTRSRQYVMLIMSSTVVTLLLSVSVFALLQVEIHLYSLAALTTSLGIVMDNAIIMVDHYRRHRDGRVLNALLGTTLTTCAGLVVIWFLPDENRQALTDFALVIAITLLVSLLVSVGFIPVVIERFWVEESEGIRLKRQRQRSGKQIQRAAWWYRQYMRLVAGLLRFRRLVLTGVVLLFGLPVFWLPSKVEATNPIAQYYNSVTGKEWYIDKLKPLMNKWLGGTLRLFINYVYEGSYQPEEERTALYIIAELPNQSTPEQMDAVLRQFETEFNQYREIDKFITQINNGQEGSLTVYFREPYSAGIFPYQLKNRAILLSTEMSGVDWDIFGVGQGFSQKLGEEERPTFNVELLGYNYRQLEEQAGVLARMLEKHSRIQTVNINRSPGFFQRKNLFEFQLHTDPSALALRDISATTLYNRLADYNARSRPDLYLFINGEYEAIKLLPVQSRFTDIWRLQYLPLNIGRTSLKLAETGTIVRRKVTPEIHKENQQYRRIVSFEYFGSNNFGEKFLSKTLDNLRTKLPLGYTAKVMDRYWSNTAQRIPYELIGLIILLIYIICSVIFESLWQPMVLIGLIPISYIGVFLAFYWTNSNFDQGGYASFVLLTGNIVCAGIFIVVEMNQLQRRCIHLSAMEAYMKAFRYKIGPVLLTVLSTVVGMVPFLLFDREPFWYAFGIGTIGGLLMSLLAIGIYLPLILISKHKLRS